MKKTTYVLLVLLCSSLNVLCQNMGIDHPSPEEKLHVSGDLRVSTGQINSDGSNLRFLEGVRADDTDYEWIGFYSGSTRQGIILYDGAWGGANNLTNEFSITAEGSNMLTLNTRGGHVALMPDGSGNVGIGTTSPGEDLDINGAIKANAIKFPDGSTQISSGKLLNAYFAITPATRQTIASTTPTAVSGLSITLTPTSTSSRFIITAVINGNMTHVSSSLLYRNGSKVQTHTGNSNEPGAQATTYGLNDGNYMQQHVMNYIDAPGTTSSVTYQIRLTAGWAGSTYTTYVNDRASNDMRTRSTLTILEYEQ